MKFIYNPDGNNTEKNSLDHAEVINITSTFLLKKPILQDILVDCFPILLIDESQDTKKNLLILITVQNHYQNQFTLGFLGDTMQRIYLDGKDNLPDFIPPEWARPTKVMNHRSQKRIVNLCNAIRSSVDGIEQKPRNNKNGGLLRVFITNSDNPLQTENSVCIHMADDMFTAWAEQATKYKAGEITKDEYDKWRYNYPKYEPIGGFHTILSQEFSDDMVDRFKDKLKDI